jgi:hypothetical protein
MTCQDDNAPDDEVKIREMRGVFWGRGEFLGTRGERLRIQDAGIYIVREGLPSFTLPFN